MFKNKKFMEHKKSTKKKEFEKKVIFETREQAA